MNFLDKLKQRLQPMLTCEQANSFIMDYLEDRLPAKTRDKFEMHLKKCVKCTPFLDQYKKTVELVAQDGQIEVPPDLAQHTIAFLRENLPDIQR